MLEHQMPDERLSCIICFQVMTKPVVLDCKAGHTYGQACIKEWIQGKGITTCPYCREKVEKWSVNEELKKEVQKLSGKCKYCEKWEGCIEKLLPHEMNCEAYYHYLEE